jgi:uncharacterized protein DUF1203
MADFTVRGIDRRISNAVRTTLRAPDYGHPVHRELATGTGPCRECLREFTVGAEDRLLFTYNPFRASERLSQPGPVFIHAESCVPFADAGYPEGLTAIPMLAECHDADGTVSAPTIVAPGSEAATLATLLDAPHVRFVHLRHAKAGCFIARVDRIATNAPS